MNHFLFPWDGSDLEGLPWKGTDLEGSRIYTWNPHFQGLMIRDHKIWYFHNFYSFCCSYLYFGFLLCWNTLHQLRCLYLFDHVSLQGTNHTHNSNRSLVVSSLVNYFKWLLYPSLHSIYCMYVMKIENLTTEFYVSTRMRESI